jgi:ketosteroid isomerase-like protein
MTAAAHEVATARAAWVTAFYRSAVNTFGDLAVEIVRIDVEGDTALEVSRYGDTFRPGTGTSLPHGGTQLVVWRRVDGSWRQAAVMVNSSFSRLVVPSGGG